MNSKTLRGLFKTLFAVALSGCAHGPQVAVCISRPASNGFVCVDRNQNPYFVQYDFSSKYVAFSPDDAKVLIDSCGMDKRGHDDASGYFTSILRREVELELRRESAGK